MESAFPLLHSCHVSSLSSFNVDRKSSASVFFLLYRFGLPHAALSLGVLPLAEAVPAFQGRDRNTKSYQAHVPSSLLRFLTLSPSLLICSFLPFPLSFPSLFVTLLLYSRLFFPLSASFFLSASVSSHVVHLFRLCREIGTLWVLTLAHTNPLTSSPTTINPNAVTAAYFYFCHFSHRNSVWVCTCRGRRPICLQG